MIMKLNVSNELKSRLMHAAENGSVIAKGKHSASCVFFSPLFLPTFVASL